MKPKTPNTLKALTQDPANLRQHNERNIGMIADALKEVGAARSIVIDEKGRILAGNGTVTAAEKAGLTKVKVIDTDGDTIIAVRRRGLTEEQKRQLAIYDNRTAETATWDTAGLAALLEHDASALDGLFTEKELAAMLDRDLETIATAGGSEPPNPTEQKLKAWQRKWKTAVNQVWQLGDHRLAIGSATTAHVWSRLMGDYDRAALVFTDPPYGVSYASERTGSIQNDDLRKNALTGLLKPAFELMARHAHDTAAFYIWHASATRRDFEWALDAAGLQENQYLSWVKDSFVLGHADYHHAIEPCFYAQKAGHRAAFFGNRKQSTIWRITRTAADPGSTINLANGLHLSDGQASNLYLRPTTPKAGKALRHLRLDADQAVSIITSAATDAWEIRRDTATDYIHPNQKPPELAIRAINNSTPGPDAIVVDCFAGSGSTLIACERTRRAFRGIELDPKFAAAILERWSAETGKTPKPAKGGTV